ncbi:MAG: monovalent cation:proton antiporter-2 (CPA2) family protein, partial [Planctomycetes bacterium]|nr:monovalent cation:proton antiporter-2 (CPA2) family protein [Planctomycetota bacterium]
MHAESFFAQAVVYLSVAVLFVPIARGLGLGSVLGYLIGGVIIGPSVLHFVGDEGQDVMHFAELGVVMLLFLIGLELDPRRLWKLRKPILGLGGTQVVVTTLVLAGIALAVGLPPAQAAAVGMTLSLSSTAIVLQTLHEKGQLRTAGGSGAFSVLLFQDMSVIPMLSVMPTLAIGAAVAAPHSTGLLIDRIPPGWETPAVLGAMTGIVLVGRFLSRYLFRFIARSGLREVFTAAALLLVVATAVLMKGLGLSPALGAFLAGVVLANNEYRRELETNLEPFKGLLLGLFFIAVGTSIDFGLFADHPVRMVGAVLGLVAVKLVVLLMLGRAFGLSPDQNRLFGFSLAQGSEFAFVLLSFATSALVLPESLSNPLMAVVAVSMALSPLLVLINERWIPSSAKDRSPDAEQMDEIHSVNPVVIAGFGRFGQIVGRFLRANGVEATVLEVDTDQVELLRQLGLSVYYGDASRTDVLDAAGAAQAKLIVVAVAGVEKSLEI